MYTQCPHCLTIFEIDEDALQASLGIVHCGHCGQRFDALRTLSETVPADPAAALAERDPEVRIPTLTTKVPLAAPEMGRPHDESTGEPAAPASGSGPDEPAPGENVVAGIPSTESGRPTSGDSSDWFADLETELDPALIADATRIPAYEMRGHNAWQVSDLPTGARFLDADIAITFEDSWTRDPGNIVGPDWRGPPADGPIGPADERARGSSAPVDPEAPSGTQAGMPFEEIGPADLEGFDPWRTEAAAPASPDRPATDAQDESDIGAPDLDERAPGEGPTPTDAGDDQPTEPPTPEPAPSGIVSDPAEPAPPIYVRPRRRRGPGIAWALGCLLLALALAAQLAWSRRVDLVRNPATHVWTTRVCRMIDCRLPPIRDTTKLELLSRDVRPDPHVPGALMITATVRNDASFRQPWPVVVVELTDLDNNPVAMRRFRPTEYMPDPARRAAGIAPGATSAVAFEVADPGKQAVAFQFGFE